MQETVKQRAHNKQWPKEKEQKYVGNNLHIQLNSVQHVW